MASLFPAIIGTAFPGAIYASQTLKFREPALVGGVAKVIQVIIQVHRRVGRDEGQRCWEVLLLRCPTRSQCNAALECRNMMPTQRIGTTATVQWEP